MAIETTIDEIVNKGNQVNQSLTEKIAILNQRNTDFKERLLDKLKIIIEAIANFRDTNLQGLTETKNNLEEARRRLQDTEAELTRTRAELEDARARLVDLQQQLTAATEDKKNLEARIAQLEQIIRKTEEDCEKRINVIRKEMADKNTEGFKEMEQTQKELQQKSDAQIAELNKQIEDLRRQAGEAQREQERANNELRDLHTKQEGLLQKLGTVNEILANQLRMINDNIDISNPEYGDYKDLLDTIENGLSGVITGINSAVSGTIGSSSSGPPPPRPPSSGPPSSGPPSPPSSGPSYDAEKNYTELLDFYKKYGSGDMKVFFTYIKNYGEINKYKIPDTDYYVLSDVIIPARKPEIIKILKKYSMIIAEPELPPRTKGGKRKTMKKRPRKTRNIGTRNIGTRKLGTRKYQKGGYMYKKDDKLNNASSVISDSSNSNSGTNSNTSKKSKKRYGPRPRPRSRTKRRSIK